MCVHALVRLCANSFQLRLIVALATQLHHFAGRYIDMCIGYPLLVFALFCPFSNKVEECYTTLFQKSDNGTVMGQRKKQERECK